MRSVGPSFETIVKARSPAGSRASSRSAERSPFATASRPAVGSETALNVKGPRPPGVAGRLTVVSRRAIGSNASVVETWMPTLAVESRSSQRMASGASVMRTAATTRKIVAALKERVRARTRYSRRAMVATLATRTRIVTPARSREGGPACVPRRAPPAGRPDRGRPAPARDPRSRNG